MDGQISLFGNIEDSENVDKESKTENDDIFFLEDQEQKKPEDKSKHVPPIFIDVVALTIDEQMERIKCYCLQEIAKNNKCNVIIVLGKE